MIVKFIDLILSFSIFTLFIDIIIVILNDRLVPNLLKEAKSHGTKVVYTHGLRRYLPFDVLRNPCVTKRLISLTSLICSACEILPLSLKQRAKL